MMQQPVDRRARRGRQRGMVTAELAVGLLTAGLVTVACVWAVSLVVVQSACADVAAQVARQLARGDQQQAREAERHAPSGARFEVQRGGREVVVTVRVERSLGLVGPVPLSGRAVVALEPGES